MPLLIGLDAEGFARRPIRQFRVHPIKHVVSPRISPGILTDEQASLLISPHQMGRMASSLSTTPRQPEGLACLAVFVGIPVIPYKRTKHDWVIRPQRVKHALYTLLPGVLKPVVGADFVEESLTHRMHRR